jgi:LysM repeat protein
MLINRLLVEIGFICLLTGTCQLVHAQDQTVVSKQSDNKIILQGKIYFVHIVKEGETLSAISAAYNVSEKVIALENPDLFAGIQTGMALKIPAEPTGTEPEMESGEYIYHVIKEGETLYALSKKYKVDLAEIEKHNPEVLYSELQINQVIKIPKKEQPPVEKEFQDNDFNYHLVKQGETLYSLSKLYSISIEEIKELNPELRWGPLKYNEYIKIPVRAVTDVFADTIRIVPAADTLMIDSLAESFKSNWMDILHDSASVEPERGAIHIGLFLPLLLHWDEWQQSADSLAPDEPESAENENTEKYYHPLTTGFLEFYEGILLAVDSLKKTGLSITLHTYDTEKNPDIVKELLTNGEVRQLDLIIGPVDPRNGRLLSAISRKYRIPMISPFFSSDELVMENPFLIQLQPSSELQMQSYAEYLSGYHDRTIVFIYSGDTAEIQKSRAFRNEILANISEKAYIDDVLFKEVVFNDSLPSDFNHTLTADTENIIIIPSFDEGEVSNILTGLYFLMEDYNIKVFGMDNWPRFRSIDLEFYHKLQLHYFTTFYVDDKNKQVREFISKFKSMYYTEPYLIASHGYNLGMLAYDIMLYFCPAVKNYGKNLIFNLDRTESHPMLGEYWFTQQHPFSGQVNQYAILIAYKADLTIEEILPANPSDKLIR